VSQLVVPRDSQLQGDSECLDGHDRYASHQGTNGEVNHWVFRSVFRDDFDDHVGREDCDTCDVEEETCGDREKPHSARMIMNREGQD
jgi:hypothetical protein